MKYYLIFILLLVVCQSQKTCQNDNNCSKFEICIEDVKGISVCQHKPSPFSSFLFIELVGIFVLAILISLASAGGVGGGEIVVPTISIFFGFSIA